MARLTQPHTLVFASLTSLAAGALISEHTRFGDVTSEVDNAEKFAAFIQRFGRTYDVDSEEYHQRLAFFQQHVASVEEQNAQQNRRWKASVNHLADWSPEELASLRGYRHTAKKSGGSASSMSLVAKAAHAVDKHKLPTNFTWSGKLNALQQENVVDQGGCGSCWAVSSATVLRAHAELYQTDRTFSAQQLVSCTPNPNSCGGSGGCGGATAELAMEYAVSAGLVHEDKFAYTAENGVCPNDMKEAPAPSLLGGAFASLRGSADGAQKTRGGAAFGMTGFRKLPENAVEPLLLAVYEQGPAVVSVAANDNWSIYSSGIMDACSKDSAVINHAVVLVGFGKEGADKFWQIQNSWGGNWGESGNIRLLRRDDKEESHYCGWDKSPEEGTACKGGPSKVWVCGQCGVLYDSVVPEFTLSDKGWLAKNSASHATGDATSSQAAASAEPNPNLF